VGFSLALRILSLHVEFNFSLRQFIPGIRTESERYSSITTTGLADGFVIVFQELFTEITNGGENI
jgi:hypothetical protein